MSDDLHEAVLSLTGENQRLECENAALRDRLSHFEAITTGSEHKAIDAAINAARKEKT